MCEKVGRLPRSWKLNFPKYLRWLHEIWKSDSWERNNIWQDDPTYRKKLRTSPSTVISAHWILNFVYHEGKMRKNHLERWAFCFAYSRELKSHTIPFLVVKLRSSDFLVLCKLLKGKWFYISCLILFYFILLSFFTLLFVLNILYASSNAHKSKN